MTSTTVRIPHGFRLLMAGFVLVMATCVLVGQPPAAKPPKTMKLEKRDEPWARALEFLSDQAGLPLIAAKIPSGNLNFVGSKGAEFTVPQVIDIYNDLLIQQKYILIRRPDTFILVPADDPKKIEGDLLPRITIEQLDIGKPAAQQRHGRTELVQVIIPLGTMTFQEAERDFNASKSPFAKIAPWGKGDHALMSDMAGSLRKYIESGGIQPPTEGDFTVFYLGTADGATVIKALNVLFFGKPESPDAKTRPVGAPYFELDATRNAIIFRGSPDQIRKAQKVIMELGGSTGSTTNGTTTTGGADRIRIITLNRGSSVQVTSALVQMWEDLRANPVYVTSQVEILPTLERMRREGPAVKPPAVKPMPPVDAGSPRPMLPAPEDQIGRRHHDGYQYVEDPKPSLSDPRQDLRRIIRDLPGDKHKPLLIAPMTNPNTKMMIASDDNSALQLAEELVRYLTQPGDGDYEVIPIKNADATEVARVVDELFNGRQQGGMRGSRGGMGDMGGMNPFMMMMGGMDRGSSRGGEQESRWGSSTPSTPTTSSSSSSSPTALGQIRVVADPRTNSILVRAPQLEMALLKKLLFTSLDTPESTAVTKRNTYMIGPLKNVSAANVVSTVRTIFSEYMVSSGRSNTSSNNQPQMSFMGMWGGQTGGNEPQSSGRRSPAMMSITSDDVTNTVIVSCPDSLYSQVYQLAIQMDEMASNNKETVVVRKLSPGMDPVLAQRLIETMTGQAQRQGQRPQDMMNQQRPFSPNNNNQMMNASPDQRAQMMNQMMQGQMRPPQQQGPNNFQQQGQPRQFNQGGNQGGKPTFGGRTGGKPGEGELPPEPPGGGGGQPQGPDFFADRVKDDPNAVNNNQLPVLYDPQVEPYGRNIRRVPMPDNPAEFLRSAPDGVGRNLLQPPVEITAPRRPVTMFVDPTTGTITFRGNQADIDEIIKILDQLGKFTAPADLEIVVYHARNQDASALAANLNVFFSRFDASSVNQRPAQQLQQASIIILPLPRQNAILLGAPKARMKDVLEKVALFDVSDKLPIQTYQLNNANATTVATLISSFYPTRVGDQNLIRITAEPRTNAIIVQGGATDQEQIARLITFMDTQMPTGKNELRIVPLKHSLAAELALILQQAIQQSTTGTVPTTPTLPTQPQVPQQPQLPQQPTKPQTQQTAAALNRALQIRFRTDKDGKILESILEDVRILPETRTNSLIVSAPQRSIDLVLALIKELDVPPTGRAEVKVFQLERSDATSMAQLIQQLFLGVPLTGQRTQQQFQQQPTRPLTVGPTTGEGAPLVDLRIAIDIRTNSLIVAGSPSDLLLVEAIILRLDRTDVRERRNEVYKLKNTSATDVATALQNFLRSEIQILGLGELTPFSQIEREVVVVPEQISNSLIISATPRFYDEVIRLIEKLDEEPPQVVIQVLLAEVRLDDTEEFGVEIGLQSPIIFRRGLIDGGITVNNTPTIGAPGFNFNTPAPLPNSSLVHQSSIGNQGISNFGVGRQSSTAGVGGFVFSASSDTFNLLIRALKTQGKIEVLSRPQITALDNQVAFIQIGQSVPYITSSNIGVAGQITNTVQQQQVGIILQVTPKISPDGHVIMRVEPQVSSLDNSTVNLGNNVFAPVFNITQASTTISASDGQTVAIGGLMARSEDKNEIKVPWLGDLPYIGTAFRFRTQTNRKSELLILLTPHIIRTRLDHTRILAVEAGRMHWNIDHVNQMHGELGVEHLLPKYPQQDGNPNKHKHGFKHLFGRPPVSPEFGGQPAPVEGEPQPYELPPPRPVTPTPNPMQSNVAPQVRPTTGPVLNQPAADPSRNNMYMARPDLDAAAHAPANINPPRQLPQVWRTDGQPVQSLTRPLQPQQPAPVLLPARQPAVQPQPDAGQAVPQYMRSTGVPVQPMQMQRLDFQPVQSSPDYLQGRPAYVQPAQEQPQPVEYRDQLGRPVQWNAPPSQRID